MNTQMILKDEAQTLALGKKIAAYSQHIHLIYLNGELGAGKTTLTRGILQGLGHVGAVKSPTYTLVETYTLDARLVHHFDLYRIQGIIDLEEMGFRDYFSEDALCLIEWPSKAAHLPKADLNCNLEIVGDERKIVLVANTPEGLAVIKDVVHGQDT